MASGSVSKKQTSVPNRDIRGSPCHREMQRPESFCKTSKKIVDFSHTWTIENFSFFMGDKIVTSPTFGAESDPETRWLLNLHPNKDKGTSKDHISLFLRLESSKAGAITAKYTLTLLDRNRRRLTKFKMQEVTKFNRNGGWGRKQFFLRDSLLKDQDTNLPGDTLIVRCEVSYDLGTENIPTQQSRVQPQDDVAEVFVELYENKTLFDVVLHLDGKEFRAHTFILAARSPILKALFELDSKAGRKSQIEVSDMTEQTLEDLLRFIYTGEADDLANMQNLLNTLDEYFRRKWNGDEILTNRTPLWSDEI